MQIKPKNLESDAIKRKYFKFNFLTKTKYVGNSASTNPFSFANRVHLWIVGFIASIP